MRHRAGGMGKGIGVWIAIALLLCLVGCGGMEPESSVDVRTIEAEPQEGTVPGEEEPPEPTEAPAATLTAPAIQPTGPALTALPTQTAPPTSPTPPGTATAGPELQVEVAAEPEDEAAESVGELELEYPARMSPGTSDIVRLSIQIPEALASLSPMSVERVAPPESASGPIGEVASDRATILLGPEMRVELSSPTFGVTVESPAVQAVALDLIAEPSWWVWSLVAPERPGSHILTLKLYLGAEATQPSWLRAYTVEVLAPSPTAAPVTPTETPRPTALPTEIPTATPIPTPTLSERIKEGMVENAAEIIISVVSLLLSGLAWLVGASWRWRKRKRLRMAELEKALAETAEEGETAELHAEIAQLDSVRWWQFWRWDD